MENTRNAYQLALLADCMTPDSPESPGARFLTGVADTFYDALDDLLSSDTPDEDLYELDAEPSVYTYEMWQQFVDIATQEESEMEGTMEQMASFCLVKIGERLLQALWTEAQDEMNKCQDCEQPLRDGEHIVCDECDRDRRESELASLEANVRADEAEVAGDPV